MKVKLSDLPPFAVGNTIQLVGAIYHGPDSNGDDRLYYCFTPGERYDECDIYELASVLEMDTADWDEFLRRTDTQEIEVSNGVEKAILRKTQRVIDAAVSWNVFRRDGYACCYCGRDNVPLTVDHLVLWEAGGPSVEPNLLSACKKCNKARGSMQYADWLRSDKYARLAVGISQSRATANKLLVDTLQYIPRVNRVRSR